MAGTGRKPVRANGASPGTAARSASRPSDRVDYRALYDVGPGVRLALSRTGVILDINPAGCHALGSREHFIVGTPLVRWLRPDSRQAMLDHLLECQSSADTVETELRLEPLHRPPLAARVYSRRSCSTGP